MNDVEIRPTIPADLDTLADVLVQVHEADGYPVEGVTNPRAWVELASPIGQWTALVDGKPVGHVALMHPTVGDGAPAILAEQNGMSGDEIAVLSRLFVSPSARGQSIARGLVHVALEAGRSTGLRVVLDVMTKDQAAISLYRSLGWARLGDFKHSSGPGDAEPALAFVAPASDTVEA